MTFKLIQTGTHGGKQVTIFDLGAGLETVGIIRFEYADKKYDPLFKELEKIIKKTIDEKAR